MLSPQEGFKQRNWQVGIGLKGSSIDGGEPIKLQKSLSLWLLRSFFSNAIVKCPQGCFQIFGTNEA